MPISTRCGCGFILSVPDSAAGSTVVCPRCAGFVPVMPGAPRRRRRWVLPVVLGGALLALAGVAAFWAIVRDPFEPTPAEGLPEKRAACREAFSAERLAASAKWSGRDAAVEKTLRDIVRADEKGDGTAFSAGFQTKRTWTDVKSLAGMDPVSGVLGGLAFPIEAKNALREETEKRDRDPEDIWVEVHLLDVRAIEEREEVVASLVVTNRAGGENRMRFWLISEDGRWSVFDWEMVETGWRYTRFAAALSDLSVPGQDAILQAMEDVARAHERADAGDVAAARRAVEKARTARPTGWALAHVEVARGYVEIAAGENEQGILALDAALKAWEDYPLAHYWKAEALSRLGKNEEALREVLEYLDGAGDTAGGWYLAGLCREALSKVEEAKADYRLGTQCEPENPACGLELARLSIQTGDVSGGFAALLSVYPKIADEDVDGWFESAAIWLRNAGAYGELSEWAKLHRDRRLDDPDSYYYSAIAATESGDQDRALSEFDLGMAAAPEEERIFYRQWLSLVSVRRGEFDRAIEHANAVLAEDDTSDDATLYRAMAYSGRGEHEAALSDLRALLTRNPDALTWVEEAPELESLRTQDGYKKLLDDLPAWEDGSGSGEDG
ncbi:MAG: tetratricopeptide repeat protein [Planctomycetes bacterium]|nr:tetratricopeptide repeat protein [Planctomycetota bacterium]